MNNKIKWSFVHELKEKSAIHIFQEQINFNFPEDYVRIILNYNGGFPIPSTFDGKKGKEYSFNCLLSFNEEDDDSIYKYYLVTQPYNIVPIANDGFGNYIGYHKADSKLYFWNHESNEFDYISDTFNELLNKLYDI